MANTKSFIGYRRGTIEVVERAGVDRNGYALWLCRCKCGKEVIYNSMQLYNKKNLNCGCQPIIYTRKQKEEKARYETPIFDGSIDELRSGITLQAVHDYRQALQTLASSKNERKLEKAKWTIDDCEKFFVSEWGDFCTFGHGRKIMEQIKSEVRGE